MKRLVSLFATIFALVAVACGGDDVDKTKPTPKPEEPGQEVPNDPVEPFVVDITNTTRGSVTFSVTPSDPTIDYLCLVYEQAKVDEYKKEQFLVETIFSDLSLEASNKGKTLGEYLTDIADCGDITDVKFTGLQMATDYYVVVFGIDNGDNGYTNTTSVIKTAFTTQDVEMSDCTFEVDARVLYNNVTFTVKPSNNNLLWYICTMTKEYYDSKVGEGEGKKSEGAFYKEYFQQDINMYLQEGYSAQQVLMALTHVGSLELGSKGLYANTEYYYLIAGMIVDEEGIVITTDITSGTYTTGDPEPSEMYFDIQIYDVQQMSVAYRIIPSNNDDTYCALVQPWDGVSTADEIMNQIVNQWGPGWMGVMATNKGAIDATTKPKSLPAADSDYYIIAFGYSGGITTEAYMKTFKTLPGGSVDDVTFSVTASSINAYGFNMNIVSSDPTIYYVAGVCEAELYNEAQFIDAVNADFDYYLAGSKDFNPMYTVAETLDQYYYNGNNSLSISGVQPDTEVMAYIYALDIKTGHVAKCFTFDSVARTDVLGTVHPTIELVGYFSGDDEAGSIFGKASLTAGRAITVVTYANFDGASGLYTTMVDNDYTDINEYPDADMWNATNGLWKNCPMNQPYTFYLSDWNVARTALVHAADANNKVGMMDRLFTMPTAEEKQDIEVLRTLYNSLKAQNTRFALPASLVAPESIKATVTEL